MKTDRVEAEVQDAGCLRWVYGIPLVLLNAATASMCYFSLISQPQGSWDHDALAGIEATSGFGLIGSLVTLALTIPTVVKRVMSRWWLAPPAVMLLIAGGRLVYVLQQYPVDSSTP